MNAAARAVQLRAETGYDACTSQSCIWLPPNRNVSPFLYLCTIILYFRNLYKIVNEENGFILFASVGLHNFIFQILNKTTGEMCCN